MSILGQLQFRRDTAANWTSNNPILLDGEIGLESDTEKFKIGNGTSTWTVRPYGGIKGDSGRGIDSVTRTSGNGAAGTTDTYTITYSDSTTSTFQVTNGADGNTPTVVVGATTVVTPATNPSVSDADAGANVDLRFSLPRARNVAAGTTNTVTPVTNPSVSSGTDGNGDVSLTFNLPRARVVSADTTNTVTPATNPSVSSSENGNGDVSLTFNLPRARTVSAGTTTTGNAGTNASVSSSTNGNGDVTLDFTIPRGAQGDIGPQGPSGVATLTASVTIPSLYSTVTVSVSSGAGIQNKTLVSLSDGGNAFIGLVESGGGTTSLIVRNVFLLAGTVGSTIASGSPVVGSGSPINFETIDVRQFGAKCDGRFDITATTTAASTALAVTTGIFTSADVGKRIVVIGAGNGGTSFVTTIAAFVSANAVTLSSPAVFTVANAAILYGTDDTPAWNSAISILSNSGGIIKMSAEPNKGFAGPTVSCVTGLTISTSGIIIEGNGRYTQQDTGAPSTFRGTGLAYVGTFGGDLIKFSPPTGASAPALKVCGIKGMALDCVQGLAARGLVMESVQDAIIDSLYIKNASVVNMDLYTVSQLGEATDVTRGDFRSISIRTLDDPNRQTDGASFIANATVESASGGVNINTFNGAGSIRLVGDGTAPRAPFPTSGAFWVPFAQTIAGVVVKTPIRVTYTAKNTLVTVDLQNCTATNPFSAGSAPMTLVTGDPVIFDGCPSMAIGIRLDGNPASSPAGNPSNSKFSTTAVLHKHGPALSMRNCDTMRIDDMFTFRASGGVGLAVDLWGGANSAASARNNIFGKLSQGSGGSGGVLVRGTDSFAVASENHFFQYHSRENGEPMPIIGIGASSDFFTSAAPSDGTPRIQSTGCVIAKRNALVTIANTETVAVGGKLPANALRVGSTISFKLMGRVTNTTTASTSVIRLRVGAATLTGTITGSWTCVMGTTARTNVPFDIEAQIVILSVSATGTAIGQIVAGNAGLAFAAATTGLTAAVACNTTIANFVEATIISGAASTTWIVESAKIEFVA